MGRQIRHIVIFAFTLAGFSCAGDPDNHPPEIMVIRMDPQDMLVPGLSVKVSALVRDPDGDELLFQWESEGGDLDDPQARETTWRIYDSSEPGSYESLTLTVSDGRESHRYTKSVQIVEGYQLRGLISFKDTRIPIGGARVQAGILETFTDSSGWYQIPSIRPGEYILRVTREGFVSRDTVFHVKSPRSVCHVPLTGGEENTGTLQGRISTLDGISFEGLQVSLLNPDGTQSASSTLSGAGGEYELASVPRAIRHIKIKNQDPSSHFLEDSLEVAVAMDNKVQDHDVRIKVLRQIFRDTAMSGRDLWDFSGDVSEGFYRIGRGQSMRLKEFVEMPPDAEKALLWLNSFVVGGCNMVGKIPSHRLWISNAEGEYIGGISWGGEGSNYPTILDWYPSESPTFLGIFGIPVRLNLEVSPENSCVPDPFWRIYEFGLSYYY